MEFNLQELEQRLDRMSDEELELFIQGQGKETSQKKLKKLNSHPLRKFKFEPSCFGYGVIALGCITVVGVAIAPALSPWTVDREAYSFATGTGGKVEFCLDTGYGGRKCPISYPDGTIENYWVKPDPVQR